MAYTSLGFLFFPVLRRGSDRTVSDATICCFYSSPSCDGDQLLHQLSPQCRKFLFFPVLRRGSCLVYEYNVILVSILPRLATGIGEEAEHYKELKFLFFPVLRRGSYGIPQKTMEKCFYSSPSCDGDRRRTRCHYNSISFYSSPSCDGDQGLYMRPLGYKFLFFPVLRRGSKNRT